MYATVYICIYVLLTDLNVVTNLQKVRKTIAQYMTDIFNINHHTISEEPNLALKNFQANEESDSCVLVK